MTRLISHCRQTSVQKPEQRLKGLNKYQSNLLIFMDHAIPWPVNMKGHYFVYNSYHMYKNDSNFVEIKNKPSTFYIDSKSQMINVELEFRTTHMFVVLEQSLE